jgi:glycosyltransferase involved in cell wall biosynthesis
MKPLVSCLTATYGRFSVLREALACFAWQTYPNKELIILNNHPEPLTLWSGVALEIRVINKPGFPNLGACRNFLLKEAKGEFIRTWDDDDLYFPWAIQQGVDRIGSHLAYKPMYSWDSRKNSVYTLGENVYEAAITFRRDFALEYRYKEAGGDEHQLLMNALHGECRLLDEEVWASYCYRWDTPLNRISGSLGSHSLEERTEAWMKSNQDTGNGMPLAPAEGAVMMRYWKDINEACIKRFGKPNPQFQEILSNAKF